MIPHLLCFEWGAPPIFANGEHLMHETLDRRSLSRYNEAQRSSLSSDVAVFVHPCHE
jgi:hypothetical protein